MNDPAVKVSGKQERAFYAEQKLSAFMSLAQNCFWTQPKPLDPRTSYEKAKIYFKPRQFEKSEKPN